jgi:hypothetical protein
MPAAGGGKRGAGHSKRKDSAEGAVVAVVDAHPPHPPHDHMDRINCPFADELDFSLTVLRRMLNIFFFTTRSCTPSPLGELANTRWRIGCDCRSPSSRFPAASENEVNPFAVRYAIRY